MGFLHRQQQRALAVVQGQTVDFFGAVADAGDLIDGNRRAAFARHDDAAEVFRAFHAGVDFDGAFLRQRANRAQRQVLIFAAHGGHHLVGADAQRLHRLWVQVNVDFALGAADERDGTGAAHVFEAFFQHLIGPIGQLDGAHTRAVLTLNNWRGS